MTILHFIAWGGHNDVLSILGQNASLFSDIANDYGELPELFGFIGSLQLEAGSAQAQACLQAAVAIRELRTGQDVDPSGRDFVDDANAQLAAADNEAEILLPIGVEDHAVERRFSSAVLCTDLVARNVGMANVISAALQSVARNHNLELLVLEYCGLTEMSAGRDSWQTS